MSDSTTSNNAQRGTLRWLAAPLLALLLAACGPTTVEVEGNFPEPLMEKVPLVMGIWYTEEFAAHEFFDEAKGRGESSWLVKTGEAQMDMWDTLLGGMFKNLEHMRTEPAAGELNQVVDAVLIPSIDELQYAIPTHTNVKVYEIWLRYRFKLVTLNGDHIAEWTMTAYGKTPTAFLQSDAAAVNLAAVVALRDAGANFATSFTRIPEVQAWLEQQWDMPPARSLPGEVAPQPDPQAPLDIEPEPAEPPLRAPQPSAEAQVVTAGNWEGRQ